jgi:RNA polymerase sigma factor (sigma-70 family)
LPANRVRDAQPAVRDNALPDDRHRRFERLALPHIDAAHNLARWLAGNTTDAEDVVQDAYLRAYRYFDSFQGGNFRVWLLTIVRNAFMTWVKENRSGRMMFVPDTPVADNADKEETMWGSRPRDPEALLLESIDSRTLGRLMEQLPTEYREVLLLREVEDLAYKEIAEVTGMPIGTVMSRLSRARLNLRKLWLAQAETEEAHGV